MEFNTVLFKDIASTSNDGTLRGMALEAADRIEALEAENARQKHELKKLWIALSTYENKVQEYVSDDWTRSDHAYDWLHEDAGETARAALEEKNDDCDA